MALPRHLVPRLSLAALLALTIYALVHSASISRGSAQDGHDHVERGSIKARASTENLRILCLGASITFGIGSTTGNGYRQYLQTYLKNNGQTPHFVGTQTSGDMENNANEGYPGARIDQIAGYGWNSYGYYPNVVLIHAGTNDAGQGLDPQVSAENTGTLIDQIYSPLPSDTLVVVSKLLPNRKSTTESRIQQFNALLDNVVSRRASQGKNVVLVDMHSQCTLDEIGPDGTHPLDVCSEKMAQVWGGAILDAVNANSIAPLKATTVSDTDNSNNVHCDFDANSIGAPSSVQFGFGNKTSTFKSVFVDTGVQINDSTVQSPYDSIFFARIDVLNRDSYVHVHYDNTFSVAVPLSNTTYSSLQPSGRLPQKCGYTSIRFSDINGDGIDDFICVDGQTAKVYLSDPNSLFDWRQLDMTIPVSGNVYIGDIDGDKAADIVLVSDSGVVSVIYPLYSYDVYSTSWTIPDFTANSTHFIDVNGDGRADYVNVAADTTVTAWLNYRGVSPVQPYWQDNGIIRHPVAGANLTSVNVKFAKIRPNPVYPQKTDIVTVHKDGTVKMFENHGYEGFAWGPYIRYCDMTGSGSESYMTMGPFGHLKLFANLHDGGFHLKYGQILGDQDIGRKDLRLADVDGDGRCDYISLNDQTGEVSVRINEGVTYAGNVSSSMALSGPTMWSVGNQNGACKSLGILFADLDGDGKSDYICIDRSGNVFTAINGGNGFNMGTSPVFSAQSDLATPLDMELISFADINGDGYADYLLFNPRDGTVTARLNTGKGQSFGDPHEIYQDSTFVGGHLLFANVNGLGRADMINVNELSAKGKMSANRCKAPTPPTGIGPNPNPPGGIAPPTDPPGNGTDGQIFPLSDTPPPGRQVPSVIGKLVWAGLGDSYSAGPGAGNAVNTPGVADHCHQHDGSYVVQLYNLIQDIADEPSFYSCTGDTTPQVIDIQVPHLRDVTVFVPKDFITLSIGGNDLGFSDILKHCLLLFDGTTKCDESISNAETIINNGLQEGGWQDLLYKTWDAISPLMQGYSPVILQQSYPSFFEQTTEWCNRQSLSFLGRLGPLLTEELRGKMNDLSAKAQSALVSIQEDYNKQKRRGQTTIQLMDANDNLIYPNQRFCEAGVENTKFQDDRIWFFVAGADDVTTTGDVAEPDGTITPQQVQAQYDASTCAQDPRYHDWCEFSIGCEYAIQIASGYVDTNSTTALTLPESIEKSFHPKSIAFNRIANSHADYVRNYIAPPPSSVDGGVLQCLPLGPDYGDAATYTTPSNAQDAVEDFCTAAKVSDVSDGVYGIFDKMIVQISTDYSLESGCATLNSDDSGFYTLCVQSLANTIDSCDTAPNGGNAAKQGGNFYKSCVTWSLLKCESEDFSDCPITPFPSIQYGIASTTTS